MLPCPVCHKAQFISSCPFRPKAQCKLFMLPVREWKSPLVQCFPHKLPVTMQNMVANILKESLACEYLYSFIATAILCLPYLHYACSTAQNYTWTVKVFFLCQAALKRERIFFFLWEDCRGAPSWKKKGGKTFQVHDSTSAPPKEKNEQPQKQLHAYSEGNMEIWHVCTVS